MRYLYAVLILLLGYVAAGFLDQNRGAVSIVFSSWRSPEWPVSIFLLLAFSAGFALSLVLGLLADWSNKVRLRRAEREAGRLAGEVARLESSRK